jgi:hypothetical protein
MLILSPNDNVYTKLRNLYVPGTEMGSKIQKFQFEMKILVA